VAAQHSWYLHIRVVVAEMGREDIWGWLSYGLRRYLMTDTKSTEEFIV